MRIFSFDQYQDFITQWISAKPNHGRGELQKMATHAQMHSSTLSQVLKRTRDFSPEQAVSICEYLSFDDLETRYFLLLVQREKAGTKALKTIIEKQLTEIRHHGLDLARVLVPDSQLSEEQKAVYYSSWIYSATRILNSIQGYQTVEALSERLSIPMPQLKKVVRFLLQTGLCKESGSEIHPGPNYYTHLEADSPFVSRHHANWRVKAMERHPILSKMELSYTSPISIAKKDAEKVHVLAAEFIEKVQKLRKTSSCEVSYCLNVDWFQF